VAISTSKNAPSRAEIRRALRERRRALAPHERHAAQTRIVRELLRLPAYRTARRIAVYFGIDGEVDLSRLVADARARHKAIFVPVLAGASLRFVEHDGRQPLSRNRYGIPEPRDGRSIEPQRLDMVLTPLVAVDSHGTRLGMGKGYYDRTFAFLTLRRRWVRPKLVGIGFAFQTLDTISAERWDVRLWGAVTDVGAQIFGSEHEL
jgi:5-formyltetrahydrofolate cyclo-ligase